MRDVLPIAYFEHLQTANWHAPEVTVSAHEICDRIAPVRQRLENQMPDTETLMSAEFILGFCSDLASTLDNCNQAGFRNSEAWQSFMSELTIEFSLRETPFSENGTYILSQLFSSHLTTLRLLTSWLLVDALGRTLNEQKLSISQQGLGLLLTHLSNGGSPIYDVEDMRGKFPDCYQ
ncbi:hypothetical protein [Cognatiyoonia sp. IB215182]|uniref:hypothetical protein n=1 Tax=Cognatiyoonia sp. IB215182 TaxID=3097353 RepID=UPI002A1590A5|nr:hypothetical protein [Cognatiyoonia sp. IB215182]MDX8355681.1 hypothetical protein [Cognatiyoonia sp. IB215182]